MPGPELRSRYTFSLGVTDDAGRTYLTERVPFRFLPLPDNIVHVVKRGDTLWTLAARYYAALPRPAGLFWVVADFQPEPVFDPTVRLADGRTVYVPSLRTVLSRVFAESRRTEEPE